jgi:hypothetical protein
MDHPCGHRALELGEDEEREHLQLLRIHRCNPLGRRVPAPPDVIEGPRPAMSRARVLRRSPPAQPALRCGCRIVYGVVGAAVAAL